MIDLHTFNLTVANTPDYPWTVGVVYPPSSLSKQVYLLTYLPTFDVFMRQYDIDMDPAYGGVTGYPSKKSSKHSLHTIFYSC